MDFCPCSGHISRIIAHLDGPAYTNEKLNPRPGMLSVQKSQSSIKHIHYSSKLQHESHDTHDHRQTGTNNTTCGAGSHHRVGLLRHRDTSAGGLHRCQTECLGGSAVAEAVAWCGSGVVHWWRWVALVSSGRNRHNGKCDSAVQLRLDSRGGSSLLGRARMGSLASSRGRGSRVGAFAAGGARRVGATSSILGRAGWARTGAGRLGLGRSRAAATILSRGCRSGVTALGDGTDGR